MADDPSVKPILIDEHVEEPSETQPLLPQHESGHPEPPVKRSLWEIAFYAVLAVIVAVLLAFFIKGFIEADEFKVRHVSLSRVYA